MSHLADLIGHGKQLDADRDAEKARADAAEARAADRQAKIDADDATAASAADDLAAEIAEEAGVSADVQVAPADGLVKTPAEGDTPTMT